MLGDVPLVIVPVPARQAGRDVEHRAPGLSQPVQALTDSGRVLRDRARTSAVRSSVSHQPATYEVPSPTEPDRKRAP